MESKQKIRKRMLEQRDSIVQQEAEEASRRIAERVFSLSAFQKAEAVFSYVSFKSEVSTKRILEYCWQHKKKTAVPKVLGEEMEFFYITSYEELEPGYFGVLEPKTAVRAKPENALMIMPGAAFDESRNRIGYGRGYYDKYLTKYPHLRSAALAYECQIAEKIEPGVLDRRPEYIITEKRLIGGA